MRGPLLFLTSQPRVLIYVGNVYAQIPARGGPPVWQYISLPRGPVGPDQPRGVHLENRILRGWTHQLCRIRADIEPFEMV